MGNTCTSVCQYSQASTVAYDQKESKDLYQVNATVEEAEKAVEAQAEYVAAKVDEAKGAVEAQAEYAAAKVDEAKEALKTKGEEIKEYVENVVEEMAAENAADAPVAVVIEKKETVEAKAEECKEPEEEVEAPEPKPPVVPLILVLAMKGQARKTVEFTYKPVGFEYRQVGKGCCAPTSKGSVKVSKVEANQQAATLGVERNAIICQANGKDIACANQLRDLIAEHLPKLPEVAVCN